MNKIVTPNLAKKKKGMITAASFDPRCPFFLEAREMEVTKEWMESRRGKERGNGPWSDENISSRVAFGEGVSVEKTERKRKQRGRVHSTSCTALMQTQDRFSCNLL